MANTQRGSDVLVSNPHKYEILQKAKCKKCINEVKCGILLSDLGGSSFKYKKIASNGNLKFDRLPKMTRLLLSKA